MPSDFFFDRSRTLLQFSGDQREINFLYRAGRELGRQSAMGFVVLGNDQAAARVLVQTMHDSGPFFAADAGKFWKVMEQSVDQRVFALTGAGMHNHTGRL